MPWEALCFEASNKYEASKYGPVTTDPFGVRLQSLSHPIPRIGTVANLRLEQDAGSLQDESLAEMKA